MTCYHIPCTLKTQKHSQTSYCFMRATVTSPREMLRAKNDEHGLFPTVILTLMSQLAQRCTRCEQWLDGTSVSDPEYPFCYAHHACIDWDNDDHNAAGKLPKGDSTETATHTIEPDKASKKTQKPNLKQQRWISEQVNSLQAKKISVAVSPAVSPTASSFPVPVPASSPVMLSSAPSSPTPSPILQFMREMIEK
jgi:hypothetical protein